MIGIRHDDYQRMCTAKMWFMTMTIETEHI